MRHGKCIYCIYSMYVKIFVDIHICVSVSVLHMCVFASINRKTVKWQELNVCVCTVYT